MQETKKVAVYYRMSSDQQTDSIERQKRDVQALLEREGYEVVPGREFIDRAKSGVKNQHQRTEFLRLMGIIERGEADFSVLVLWDLSRFSRENPLRAAHFYDLLRSNGILLHDCRLGKIDLGTQHGRILVSVISETNHAEVLNISSRSVSGRGLVLAAGWWPCGTIPYGYDRLMCDPKTGQTVQKSRRDRSFVKGRGWHTALVINPTEAEIVQQVFTEYTDKDTSLRQIAAQLNGAGVLSPSGDPSKAWDKDNLRDLLRQKAYCGYIRVGKHRRSKSRIAETLNRMQEPETKSDKVPAIVSEDLWNRADEKLAARRKNRTNPRPGHSGFLSGVLYCGHCGYALEKKSRRANGSQRLPKDVAPGEEYVYYQCSTSVHHPNKTSCHQWRVNEKEILPFAMVKLRKQVEEALLKELDAARERKFVREDKREKQLRKQLDEIERLIKSAFHNMNKLGASGLSSSVTAQLEEQIQEYIRRKEEVEQEIRRLQTSVDDVLRAQSQWERVKQELACVIPGILEPCNCPTGNEVIVPVRHSPRAEWSGEIEYPIGPLEDDDRSVRPTMSYMYSMKKNPLMVEKARLRGFLKDIRFQIRLYWKAKDVDKKGRKYASRRCFEVDWGILLAELDSHDVGLSNAMRGRRTNTWATTPGSTLKPESSSSSGLPSCSVSGSLGRSTSPSRSCFRV